MRSKYVTLETTVIGFLEYITKPFSGILFVMNDE